jgi:F-type H+-transporting ATPase subunit delta
MPKITPQQYAISLYQATKDRPRSDIEKNLANFVKILHINHDLKKLDQIIRCYEAYAREQCQVMPVELITAKRLTSKTQAEIVSYLKTKLFPGASDLKIEEKIDKNLIGGIIIKSGDLIIDGSLARRLQGLKRGLIS